MRFSSPSTKIEIAQADIRVDQDHAFAAFGQRRAEIGGGGRLADAAFARRDDDSASAHERKTPRASSWSNGTMAIRPSRTKAASGRGVRLRARIGRDEGGNPQLRGFEVEREDPGVARLGRRRARHQPSARTPRCRRWPPALRRDSRRRRRRCYPHGEVPARRAAYRRDKGSPEPPPRLAKPVPDRPAAGTRSVSRRTLVSPRLRRSAMSVRAPAKSATSDRAESES